MEIERKREGEEEELLHNSQKKNSYLLLFPFSSHFSHSLVDEDKEEREGEGERKEEERKKVREERKRIINLTLSCDKLSLSALHHHFPPSFSFFLSFFFSLPLSSVSVLCPFSCHGKE